MGRRSFDNPALRGCGLFLLLGFVSFLEAAHQGSLASAANADFWWHLRVGAGILQAHALPHSGLYSQSSALPWIASSWLYDVVIAAIQHLLGWLVAPVVAIVCKFALAAVTFVLVGGLRGRFWTACLVSAAAQFVLVLMPPLPVFVSALLFGAELLLLAEFGRVGNVRTLYWLAPLFLVWANVDANFVFGIAALLLYVASSAVRQWGIRDGVSWLTPAGAVSVRRLAVAAVAAVIASFLTPYGWGPYGEFFAQLGSAANAYFPDAMALRFRSPHDYVLLLLMASAFLALGIRRSRDPFPIALLLLCAFASFRAQRDAWLAVMASVAVLGDVPADALSADGPGTPAVSRQQFLLAASVAFVFLAAVAATHFPHRRDAVLAKVARRYPVAAADYIRDHHLPQPLFNSLPWGGFLTWYLPEYPVAIDGRTSLFGDDWNVQYAKVMNAEQHFSTFAPLNQAGTLLLEKNSLMGGALATVPAFKVAYSDDVAVVLVREQDQP